MVPKASQFSFLFSLSPQSTPLNSYALSTEYETTSIDGQPFLHPFEFAQLLTRNAQLPTQALISHQIPSKANTSVKNCKRKYEVILGSDEEEIHLFDSDEEEIIEKKVKMEKCVSKKPIKKQFSKTSKISQNETVRENSDQSTNSLTDTHDIIPSPTRTPEFTKIDNSEKISSKNMKVVQIYFDQKQEKILYEVQFRYEDGTETSKTMKKEELLKENPLALLYLYEENIRFDKVLDFDLRNLKKFQPEGFIF